MNKEQLSALLKEEVQISAIRSSGPGGQNVNTVSTGIHLRFDIKKFNNFKNKNISCNALFKYSRINK